MTQIATPTRTPAQVEEGPRVPEPVGSAAEMVTAGPTLTALRPTPSALEERLSLERSAKSLSPGLAALGRPGPAGLAAGTACGGLPAQALAELRALLGESFVLSDAQTLRRYARSCFPQTTRPSAVVRPACTREVQEVVRLASRWGLALHPLSCGKNWGYGDACAATPGQVILDLKRMNRILEVHSELAYATVEPGVTQGQLADLLAAKHPELWMDATGAGRESSVLGNTVERGFGHTHHGDRFLNACGMEVVLPDGRLLKTGFGHYQGAQAAAVYKWGLGPYLDGLFTQSNMGIVTRLTFWLIPRPKAFRAFFFTARSEEDLGDLVEALRPLRLSGTLRTVIHLFNDLRLIAGGASFPWETADGRRALDPLRAGALRRAQHLDAWTGTGGLYGSPAEVAAALSEVRQALRRVRGLRWFVFADERRMRWAERGVGFLDRLGLGGGLPLLVRRARLAFDLLRGRPADGCLRGALWRTRPRAGLPAPASPDPLEHNAGFYWVSPVMPMTRAHVERFSGLAKAVFERYGFEYQVTFSLITARALCAVTTIAFDQTNPEEAGRAERCHDEFWRVVVAAGYIPYRAGNPSMARLADHSEVFWDVAARIKSALDPQGILARGHYEPGVFVAERSER